MATNRSTHEGTNKRTAIIASLFFLGCCCLMGCAEAAQPGDPERGKQLYNTPVKAERVELDPCSKCHPVGAGEKPPPGRGINLSDIGSRAGKTVKGQSAEEYLRTSIIDTDAYLAGGFQDGLMSREYKKLLTSQQVEDLTAYMLTLKK